MPKDMHGVMREFKHGELHSGSKGPVVKDRKQAIAIGLSEQRQQGKPVPPKKKSRREPTSQRFAEHAPPGFGSLSRQPRPIKNTPKTLTGRRDASHFKAYGK